MTVGAGVRRCGMVPVLDRAGLDHVAGLIAAALVHDGNPCAIARGVATPQ